MIMRGYFFGLLFIASWLMTTPAHAQTVGIKNFRQYLGSLETATGISSFKRPEISAFFGQNMSRMPKHGLASELDGPALMTLAALSGLFCKAQVEEWAKGAGSAKAPVEFQADRAGGRVSQTSQAQRASLMSFYSRMFLDRDPTRLEERNLSELAQKFGDSSNAKLAISFCVAYAASLEFIAL